MDIALLDLYRLFHHFFGLAAATGMTYLIEDASGHDMMTHFISAREVTSADLWGWRIVNPQVRRAERATAMLIHTLLPAISR